MSVRQFDFWIDRGGTFTDIIGRDASGRLHTLKLPSAARAYDDAAVEGMRRMLGVDAAAPFPAASVGAIKLGTTVATNALLERTGAKTLFITTRGFADALLIGDQSRPALFALDIVKPEPLYAGVVEADERLDASGAVVRPLDTEALAQHLRSAVDDGYVAAAIAFLHADLNPAHELAGAALARAAGFRVVSLSHEVSPAPRFVPRAETTVADAYLTPVVRGYADRITRAVGGAPVYFMTSAGGLVRADAFRGKDAVLSGPAGGVVGVARTAQACGVEAALGFDMGGTSTDVCRFSGALERRDAARVAGARLRTPMLDVETVAAGGGSILSFDGLRARVGPASAGADPGPAAYGRGGPPTITDANLVLGRIDASAFPAVFGPDQDQPLDLAAAHARLTELAEAMGAENAEAAAEGFVAVAVEQAAQAIGRISTERGFDPREHALVAFGGAAGQIVCWVAEALDIGEVLCPRYASLLSAWGIGQAEMRSLKRAGLERPLDAAGLADAVAEAKRLQHAAAAELRAQGAAADTVQSRLRLRYAGADAELVAPLAPAEEMRAGFEAAHRRLFGFVEPQLPVLIAGVEVEAAETRAEAASAPPETGRMHPSPPVGAVFADAMRAPLDGPALILRDDTQIAVASGWRAEREAGGLIRLRRAAAVRRTGGQADAVADPVTLELFNRRFMGVAEAMGAALERTAHSVNIKERLDFSCALFDAAGGLVANAPHMPVHLGSMGASVRAVAARRPDFRPGEAFALNNPFAGGTHLPDITVVMPVSRPGDARPSFFVAARGHHADVGGVQPGSMPPFSHTIGEEGVMLDALPIMRDGAFLETDVRRALGARPWPARNPDQNVADLKAQIAACEAGAAAVAAMIELYGAEQVARYMAFVQENAAASVRRAVGALTDGAARVPMDGGGEIVVAISVDASSGRARIDFTGTSGVLASNFNAPSSIVDAAVLYVFRTLVDDDIPLNAGCLEPLTIVTPQGSMLAPAPPAAVVAGNVETSQHIVDALYAALGVMAASQGTMNNLTFGDAAQQYYETICGGAGATATAGGADAVHTHMTNSRLTDPEILERRFPARVESFRIRRGSGGAGRNAGGDGAVRRIRFLAAADVALLSTRREHSPQGLAGGAPACPGRQRLLRANGAIKDLAGCFSVAVQPGDSIEIETPGGGGFGPPGP
ncbi:MAG TPA: hydantoinase B/oxoprolinase family protein [Caulobacteraceae bacterium]|nr:hydantoinase B/oxoprolinase family protein [Caulobacteraceae bacterium]